MTRVATAAHVVAAGLASPGVARAVIVLLPAASTAGGVALENWPSQAHALLRGRARTHLDAVPAPGTATPEPWRLRPGSYTPDDAELAATDRLWQRLMAPAGEWPDVLKVFEGVQGPPGQHTEAVPLPTAEAGLAIPLERGRRLLEALAAPGSPILARAPTRPGPASLAAVGRPWLGEPGTLARLASRQPDTLSDAERSLLLGPPDVRDWIAARNSGNKDARRAGDEFYGSPLDPDDLADAALGADGRDMLATFDRMHALHHQLVTDGPGARIPPLNPPLRRVTQLMGSPALLRLFGLAFDVLVELPSAAADGPWRVSWSGADVSWPCAAKLSRKAPGSGFWPATLAEWTGVAAPAGSVPEADGVVLLGQGGLHGLVTLEAALAVCGDYHRQAVGDPDRPPGSDSAATPISGGLTVVRMNVKPVRRQDNPAVLCSEDLRAFYRFDVGLDVEPAGPRDPGTEWRSVMHRSIRWSDPAPDGERLDMEAVLAKLMPPGPGNPCALPRHELEAGICAAVTLTRNDGTQYADPRIAIFNGYPGGEAVNEVWWDGERPRWGHRPISIEAANGLALNQAVSVPRNQPGALIPPLRFGWRYRAGIRIVWLGGVARPLADAADHYRRSAEACLPVPAKEGHCYLRHEPVHAPEVFLPPSVPLPRPGGPAEDSLQSAAQAVVVSWPGSAPAGHRAVASTARVLLPSVVALEFAGLHEVFDGPVRLMDAVLAVKPPSADGKDRAPKHLAAKVPADGLRVLAFEGAAEFERDKHVAHGSPPRVSVPAPGRPARRPVPYYPDPAACFLAVGLRDPASRRWIVPPRLVRVRGDLASQQGWRWPDILPVVVELAAGTAAGRHLVVPAESDAPSPAAGLPVPCRTVRAVLGPGEQATLEAWFVPSLDDLTQWFDLCETAAQLATRAGAGNGKDEEAACRAGLTWLLGENACKALPPGSGEGRRRAVASLVWARLSEEPVEAIAKVRSIPLLHAVPAPLRSPELVPGTRPFLVRRRDTSTEAVAAYLADPLASRESEDGAVQAVVRGMLRIDLPSTSGLLVEATMAAPQGPLDVGSPKGDDNLVPLPPPSAAPADAAGRPDFRALRTTVKLLEIDGIPLQPDGVPSPQRVSLDALQSGTPDPDQAGAGQFPVQVKRGARFADGGARKVDLRITALPRHAAFLGAPLAEPRSLEVKGLWLNATIRPGEPDVRCAMPTFQWTDTPDGRHAPDQPWTWSRTRESGLRVELRRPWFKSGEGEQLGILIWPPVLPIGSWGQLDPVPSDAVMAELLEDDIGPLGPFVSAWARDPLRDLEKDGAPTRFPMRREHFAVAGAEWSDAVLVPIAGGQVSAGLDGETVASVLRVPPRFDHDGGVWFVDIGFAAPVLRAMTDRFVRLGLVRFQPNARPDFQAGRGDRGIQCSPPASVWGLLPPRRELRVTLAAKLRSGDGSVVAACLLGTGDARRVGPKPRTRVTFQLVLAAGDNESVVLEQADVQPEQPEGTSDTAWVAVFERPLRPAQMLGRYAVLVSEEDVMPSVHENGADDGPVRFFARIELSEGPPNA